MLGIIAVGVVRESRKFSGHPCMGHIAHCAVIFAIVQLSCYFHLLQFFLFVCLIIFTLSHFLCLHSDFLKWKIFFQLFFCGLKFTNAVETATSQSLVQCPNNQSINITIYNAHSGRQIKLNLKRGQSPGGLRWLYVMGS